MIRKALKRVHLLTNILQSDASTRALEPIDNRGGVRLADPLQCLACFHIAIAPIPTADGNPPAAVAH